MWQKIFKRRPINVLERTKSDLTDKRDFHNEKQAAFEDLARHYDELARQHREASAAISDALSTLDIAADPDVLTIDLGEPPARTAGVDVPGTVSKEVAQKIAEFARHESNRIQPHVGL